MNGAFILFGFSHVVAVVVVLAIMALVIRKLPKRIPEDARARFDLWLAVLILSWALSRKIPAIVHQTFSLSQDLPFHLCGISRYLIAFYLFKPNRKLFDVLFYWILGGSSLALIFPDIKVDFPSTEFFSFFLSHSLPLFAMLYLLRVRKMQPSESSFVRAFVTLNIYAFLIVLPVDLATGGNYLFLFAVPNVDFGPIELLPSWPWYLAVLDAFFLLLFRGLYKLAYQAPATRKARLSA